MKDRIEQLERIIPKAKANKKILPKAIECMEWELRALKAEQKLKKCSIPDVRVRFSDIDKLAWEKIEQEYEHEDIESDDEIMQGEIQIALAWYKQGIRDVLNAL